MYGVYVVWTHGDGPSYGPGTGHHTVPLSLATDISKLPIVGIGVSILLYGSEIWLSVYLSAAKYTHHTELTQLVPKKQSFHEARMQNSNHLNLNGAAVKTGGDLSGLMQVADSAHTGPGSDPPAL